MSAVAGALAFLLFMACLKIALLRIDLRAARAQRDFLRGRLTDVQHKFRQAVRIIQDYVV